MDERRGRTEVIESWAREAGFDLVAVGALAPPVHGEAFVRWLERGDHAGMEYLERHLETRLDPQRLLPGARSIVCLGLRYAPLADGPLEGEAIGDLWPRVARYARGDDYHDFLKARLVALATRIRDAYPGTQTRVAIDTSAVLERDLAAAAGLGWIGKNTMLIHPSQGSWFLIGEIFTSLDLEPGDPMADRCGTCTRCLDACPTGAIAEPYRVDANRCISYWTIEHRGEIPVERRAGMGEWVFGCDVCQEVCPFNRKPEALDPLAAPEFAIPERRRTLDLADLLGLERDPYVELFRGSPMKRARLEGLKRNAAIATENRRASGAVPR